MYLQPRAVRPVRRDCHFLKGEGYIVDTKDTLEKTDPLVAPAKPAPKPTPLGEPYAEPVLSASFSDTKDDFLDMSGLGVAFSELRVGTCEGKEMEKEEGEEGAGAGREVAHERTHDAHSAEMRFETASGATGLSSDPASSSPTATTPPATHPATSPATTTPPVAESAGLSGAPYPTHGVDPHTTAPSVTHPVTEPVGSGSSYSGIHEPSPCENPNAYRSFPSYDARLHHARAWFYFAEQPTGPRLLWRKE